MSDPRFAELLRALVEAGVEFILVGGLAVNAHGYVRGTTDLDIVPARRGGNLERLAAALVELNGRVEVEGRVLAPQSTLTILRAGDWAHLTTPLGDIDVLQSIGRIPSYEQLLRGAEVAELLGVEVKVCSLDDLIDMKAASDRFQDRADLEALEAIRDAREEEHRGRRD